jgi:hypothetical protein
MKKKTGTKKEEPELIGNEVGVQFDIAGFRKQLQAYQIWLLGYHMNEQQNIAYHCAKDLENAMSGGIPSCYMDGCAYIQPKEKWIEHQWEVKQTADAIWNGILKDYPEKLSKLISEGRIKKKHWWQR